MMIEELPLPLEMSLPIDVPEDEDDDDVVVDDVKDEKDDKYEKTFAPIPVTHHQTTEYIALEVLRRKRELDDTKGARGAKVTRLLEVFNAARRQQQQQQQPFSGKVINPLTDGDIFQKNPKMPADGLGYTFFQRNDSVPCLRARRVVVPRHDGDACMIDEQALEEEKERKRQQRQLRQEQKEPQDEKEEKGDEGVGEVNDEIVEVEEEWNQEKKD